MNKGFKDSRVQVDKSKAESIIGISRTLGPWDPGTLDPLTPRTLILIFKPNPVPYLCLLVFGDRDIEADEVSLHLFIGVGV